MRLIPLSKGYAALVDDEDAHLADLRWNANVRQSGVVYGQRIVPRPDGGETCLMLHREVLGLEPGDGKTVDHINGDGLDCRRANLRIVTVKENARNRAGANAKSASGLLGVHRRGARWQATIRVDGKYRHLGSFRTPEEAHVARLSAERNAFGIQPRRAAAFETAGV